MKETLPTWDAISASLAAPLGRWQISVVLVAALAALLVRWILNYRGLPRATLRVVPVAVLWGALLIAQSVLRRQGLPVAVIELCFALAGTLLLVRFGTHAIEGAAATTARARQLARTLAIGIWVLVGLALVGWLPEIEHALDAWGVQFGKTRISLDSVARLLIWGIVFLLVAMWLSNLVSARLARNDSFDAGVKLAYGKLARVVFFWLAVVFTLTSAGVDLTAFAVFGGALGVGLGLGLQRIVSNFVSGFILLFERSIKPGDIIKVGDIVGTLRELRARHAVILAGDGTWLLVPNEQFLTTAIVNWSYGERSAQKLSLPVSIGYGDDPERAIAILESIARDTPHVRAEPVPVGLMTGFGDSALQLELVTWVDDPGSIANVRSAIGRRVLIEFRKAGISMPFPQREVRLLGDQEKHRDGSIPAS